VSAPNEIVFLSGADSDYLTLRVAHPDSFHKQLDDALSIIEQFPLSGKAFGSFRRIHLQDTPFAFFYVVDGSKILVSAILDMRQDPETIQRLLKERS